MDTVFEFDYSVRAEDMRSLYEKAKRDQWNATPRHRVGHARARPTAASSPTSWSTSTAARSWDTLSERDRVELNRRITAWRLSVLVYGEQGAMLACSQLVDIVPGTDEKFFQATQVMDEARHNEVLERYIQTRLGGLHYPMPENERVLFDAILTDPRWYIKTIALQLVAETFAVVDVQDDGRGAPRTRSSARSAGASCRTSRATWASACSPCPRSCARRARRSAGRWRTSPASPLEKVLTGFFPLEAYRDLGFSRAQIDEVQRLPPRRRPPGTTTRCTGSTSSATCTRPWSTTWRASIC